MDPAPTEPPPLPDRHRRLLWGMFWFVFLSTPCLAIFGPFAMRGVSRVFQTWSGFPISSGGPFMIIGGMIGGSIACGFILSKLYSKTADQFIRRGILLTLAVVGTYAAIAGAGCAALLIALR